MFGTFARRRLSLVGVLLVALAAGLQLAGPSAGAQAPTPYVVRPGDTVWSIAASQTAGDPRGRVAAILRQNHLEGQPLRVGQTLLLPAGS